MTLNTPMRVAVLCSACLLTFLLTLATNSSSYHPPISPCPTPVVYERVDRVPTAVSNNEILVTIMDDEMLGCNVEIRGNHDGGRSFFFPQHWTYGPDEKPFKPAWCNLEKPKAKDAAYSISVTERGLSYGANFHNLKTQYQRIQPFQPRCEFELIQIAAWQDLGGSPEILTPDEVWQTLNGKYNSVWRKDSGQPPRRKIDCANLPQK